jgi:uncharacterized delta-60 repeat protein
MKTLRFILLLLPAVFSPGLIQAQTTDPFDPNANGNVFVVAGQPDGKMLVGGSFTSIGGIARNFLARMNADGSLDSDFNPGANGSVWHFAVQTDGKILVGGSFTSIGGQTRNNIARLNADGTVDSGFNPNCNGMIGCMAVVGDGKILIGGDFTTVGGQTRNYIARLNIDGSVDSSFNPNANNGVRCIAWDSSGKILLGGGFTSIGAQTRNYLARINQDGTLDSGFNPGANNAVVTMAIQSDGKILVGGDFTTIGGQSRSRMARLDANGVVEAGYNPNSNNSPLSFALQADGKVVVGGAFINIGGLSRQYLARLNVDGSADTSFLANADLFVNALYLQRDGKVCVGGIFNNIGGVTRNRIARLNNNSAVSTIMVTGASQIDWQTGGTTPEMHQVVFESWNGSAWSTLGVASRVAGGYRLSGLTLPASGQIRARGRTTGGYRNGSSNMIEQVTSYAPPLTVASVTPSVGSITGGTSVTITGTGFTGASAVTFGGTPAASFTVNSDTSITATTPARAAGTVDVSVTATAGSGTGTGLFTYYGPPVADFIASPNPAMPNQMINFYGYYSSQSAPGGSITVYQWNWGDGSPAGSGATPDHYYPLFGSYQVTLTVTDNFGQTASKTSTVMVNQGNTAPVANAGGPYTIRVGQSLVLDGRASTDPNLAQGDSIVEYAWDLDNNGTYGDVMGANPTVSWSSLQFAAGTYTIKVRVKDSFGLTSIASATLTINPLPTTTPTAATGITTTGATLNGTVNANGTPSTVTFEWGTTTGYGNSIAATPSSVSGNTATAVSAALTGLAPHTTYYFRVRATWIDGSVTAGSNTFTTANTPPTFAGYSVSTAYQTAATISLAKLLTAAADADGDALSVTAAGPASTQGGTAVLQSGSILYTPPAAFSGTDSFSVTIADGYGASVSGTVTVSVAPNPNSGGQGVNPPQITMPGNGTALIASQGIPGRTYMVQRSTNLSSWATIGTVTAASNGAVSFIDPSPPQPSAFYRLGRNVPEMNFWGNGSDGALTTTGNVSFASVQDGDVVVKQFTNLTINAGHTVTTSNRCRGLVIYVNGDCTINGTLSMTARGANVDPTQPNSIAATGIRLARSKYGANETLSASDLGGTGLGGVGSAWRTAEANQLGISGTGRIYTISREGGAGGAARFVPNGGTQTSGLSGDTGTNGTGGGASGGSAHGTSGAGSAGTCFSGGSGGGGANGPAGIVAGSGSPFGGSGGAGAYHASFGTGGGAGNPGGFGYSPGLSGGTGTGGLLILMVKGNLVIGSSGAIRSEGTPGGSNAAGTNAVASGGGSGGGRIIVLHSGTISQTGTISANGILGGGSAPGGNGAITIDRIDP